MNPGLKSLLYQYSRLRSAHFAIQYWSLNSLARLIGFKTPIPYHERELLSDIRQGLIELLKADVDRIAQNIYPAQVLLPDLSPRTLALIPQVMIDTFRVGSRRTRGVAQEFTTSARKYFDELPDYYLRNFHFQTDGYLAEKSAAVYDYEVELLFSGSADAMRRLIIEPMKSHFTHHPPARNLHFLEIGAGTGRATRFIKMAFPSARITLLDLSDPYLKVAQRQLKSYDKLCFMQGDGAALPFKKQRFDAVYSVFMFHELPDEVRRNVMKESFRVLRSGGFLGTLDSIQLGDYPKFDAFLKDFPKNFHEPFYRNYIQSSAKELFSSFHLKNIKSQRGLLSKCTYAIKPHESNDSNRPNNPNKLNDLNHQL
jgi:ubiquinone/menaquinone biosynthesis C-methylase UbiE